MAKTFNDLCDDAKTRIREVSVQDVAAMLDAKHDFILIDVREDNEWLRGRLPGSVHLGRGILERDAHEQLPALDAEIVLYCGGGFRSALAADSLRTMGYTNAASMAGGVRGWVEEGRALEE